MEESNALAGADEIILCDGTYVVRQLVVVSDAVTLRGDGSTRSVVDGSGLGSGRLLVMGAPSDIQPVILRGIGFASGGGLELATGAAYVQGCSVSGQSAPGVPGGGMAVSGGDLTLVETTLENNVGGQGGGLFVGAAGRARLERCLVSGNSADTGGGLAASGGSLVVVNTTLWNNDASSGGGLQAGFGATVRLRNVTAANNRASAGGGVANVGATVVVANSILGDNAAPTDPDAAGALSSLGHNIVEGDPDALPTPGPGDQAGVDAGLDPAGPMDNGGMTPTVALQAASPAVDAGSPSSGPSDSDCDALEQRGFVRTLQNPRCDTGAYEGLPCAGADADGDTLADDCDPCDADVENDADGDGVCESDDNCDQDPNADQADGDGDGVGDACEPGAVSMTPSIASGQMSTCGLTLSFSLGLTPTVGLSSSESCPTTYWLRANGAIAAESTDTWPMLFVKKDAAEAAVLEWTRPSGGFQAADSTPGDASRAGTPPGAFGELGTTDTGTWTDATPGPLIFYCVHHVSSPP